MYKSSRALGLPIKSSEDFADRMRSYDDAKLRDMNISDFKEMFTYIERVVEFPNSIDADAKKELTALSQRVKSYLTSYLADQDPRTEWNYLCMLKFLETMVGYIQGRSELFV